MKRYISLLAAVLLLAVLWGCSREDGTDNKSGALPADSEYTPGEVVWIGEEPVFDYEGYDWRSLLLSDAFESDTVIGNAALEAVELSVGKLTETEITVTVKAPHIFDELYSWYSASEAESSEVEERIAALLAGEKESNTFTLSYSVGADGEPRIDYTTEYGSAVSCGLIDFCGQLNADFIGELGGGVYD